MSVYEAKPRTSRSLTFVLTRVFPLLALAALLLIYLSQLISFTQVGNRMVASEQQLIAKDVANTVVGSIRVMFDTLETAARLTDLASVSRQDQKTLLANLLGRQSAFRQIAFFDSQGQEVTRVSRLAQVISGNLVAHVETDWFTRIMQGNSYIGPIYVDEVTSEPLVMMAIPVRNIFGDFQGALVAEVNLKFMWDLVSGLKVGKTGLAYVVDKQGHLIAFRDIARVLRAENLTHLPLVAAFVADAIPADGTVTKGYRGIDGRRVIGTCLTLGRPNWAIVIELPAQEATDWLIRRILFSLGLVIVITAAVSGGTILIARRLTVPLLALTATVTQIAEGKLDLQAALQGPTEVLDLARAFNRMTARLRETLAGLEQRVAERTLALGAVADVARATTSVLDLDRLLPQVVDLVQERFGFYYVGLFLADEERRYAVLRAGTGEAGRAMLAEGWKLPIGMGSMIGQCVAGGRSLLRQQVGDSVVYFENPYLPDTRSELALPLRYGERTIGAMTVQSVEIEAFDESAIAILQNMADQVAVAVENARLFSEMQMTLNRAQEVQRRYQGRAWREYVKARAVRGYEWRKGAVLTLDAEPLPETRPVLQERAVTMDEKKLLLPLIQGDQLVGVLGFENEEGRKTWRADEIALLEALAEQLLLAAENQRLLDETQRRAARERLSREITAEMRRSLDITTVLRTALRQFKESLDLTEAEVWVETGAPESKT